MVPLVGMELRTEAAPRKCEDEVLQSAKSAQNKVRFFDRHHDRIASGGADWRIKSPNMREFFSFGTNDLTQTTLGISRDDAGRFLSTYVSEGLFEADPFTIH